MAGTLGCHGHTSIQLHTLQVTSTLLISQLCDPTQSNSLLKERGKGQPTALRGLRRSRGFVYTAEVEGASNRARVQDSGRHTASHQPLQHTARCVLPTCLPGCEAHTSVTLPDTLIRTQLVPRARASQVPSATLAFRVTQSNTLEAGSNR